MDFECGMVALAPETGGDFKIVRKAEWGESGVDFQCGMVALAPETGGGFKIVRKAEWGESGVVPPSGHSLLPATNFCSE